MTLLHLCVYIQSYKCWHFLSKLTSILFQSLEIHYTLGWNHADEKYYPLLYA